MEEGNGAEWTGETYLIVVVPCLLVHLIPRYSLELIDGEAVEIVLCYVLVRHDDDLLRSATN